jgi:hypothetical protein
MSMKKYISEQARSIADAFQARQRVDKIDQQVRGIMEDLQYGNEPKIQRGLIDDELYNELEALGIVGEKQSKPAAAQNKRRKGIRALPINFPSPPPRAEQSKYVKVSTSDLQSGFDSNTNNLASLVVDIDNESDDAQRGVLQERHDRLLKTQQEIWSELDRRRDDRKRKQPPAQTPLYLEAKRAKGIAFAKSVQFKRPTLNLVDALREEANDVQRTELNDDEVFDDEVTPAEWAPRATHATSAATAVSDANDGGGDEHDDE